jgi:hypothetical protein
MILLILIIIATHGTYMPFMDEDCIFKKLHGMLRKTNHNLVVKMINYFQIIVKTTKANCK